MRCAWGVEDLSSNCCQSLSEQGRQIDAHGSCAICREAGAQRVQCSHTLALHAQLFPLWQVQDGLPQ